MLLPYSEYSEELLKRPFESDESVTEAVMDIIDEVRKGGDEALRSLSERFDGCRPDSLFATAEEIAEAEAAIPQELKDAIGEAARNILAFHKAQMPEGECVETAPGVICSRKVVPIEKVGLYIPGGTAPLFSTVLMLAIPAKAAGCSDIMLATPARDGRVNPAILYAASVSGVDRILKVGGAQAIAAFAFGTESVSRRDKVFGPGNRFVSKAKELVSRYVAIDMVAGPSEILVIADETADPAFIAADLLSQAEHGSGLEQAVLVTVSEPLLEQVEAEFLRQKASLPRLATVDRVMEHGLFLILAPDLECAAEIAGRYAPEHLEIQTARPERLAKRITAAGAIFLGPWTPEPVGDFCAGPSHVLPTASSARYFNGLETPGFFRRSSIVRYSESALRREVSVIEAFAEMEGLAAHGRSGTIRVRRF